MPDIETLTLKQICSYVAIVNKMEQEGIIKVNIDKSYVEFDYDRLVNYLEKQNVELKKVLENIAAELIKLRYDYRLDQNTLARLSLIEDHIEKALKEY